MPLGDVCYPYTFNYSWMYGFATKRTLACPMAKYGPPPRSLVGSPASWGRGTRGRPGPFSVQSTADEALVNDSNEQQASDTDSVEPTRELLKLYVLLAGTESLFDSDSSY